MVLMRSLIHRGLVECKGAVATLAPSRARGRLLRGTLSQLGLSEVPVAVGSDGGFAMHEATFEKTASSYMPDDDDSFNPPSGEELLVSIYKSAAPASLDLLIIASLKDAAEFVRNHEGLFKQKSRSVTIMGGVMPFSEDDDDDTLLLVPDTVRVMFRPSVLPTNTMSCVGHLSLLRGYHSVVLRHTRHTIISSVSSRRNFSTKKFNDSKFRWSS